MDSRSRTLTSKGADYMASLQIKKNAALARVEAKKASAKSKIELDGLSDLFSKVSVAQNDTDVDALTNQIAKMGGRRKKTRKTKSKKSKKTRKH